MVSVGDKAPIFELPRSDGGTLHLSDVLGKRIVLFFYPKDGTPGCTRENCLIRDMLPEFEKHGVLVLGISRDGIESHKKFAEKYKLTHILLSDVDGEASKAYGVLGSFGMSKRVTFIIDESGTIRKIIQGQTPDRHVKESLEFLKSMDKGSGRS